MKKYLIAVPLFLLLFGTFSCLECGLVDQGKTKSYEPHHMRERVGSGEGRRAKSSKFPGMEIGDRNLEEVDGIAILSIKNKFPHEVRKRSGSEAQLYLLANQIKAFPTSEFQRTSQETKS